MTETANNQKIVLSAPLTHSDWMIQPNNPEWGPEGVRQMLELCKAAGWTKIYWRVFDAGLATYKSKLMDPAKFDTSPEPNYHSGGNATYGEAHEAAIKKLMALDYTNFDTLATAIEIGHELGMEIHAWLSINEDDHGWGWASRFSKAHPEFRWVRRDGFTYHSQLSFAFPEVRKYKLDLVKEILAYDIDGIFLDWIRTGDTRDNPQNTNGVPTYGYEKPNIEAFKAKYGVDPHEVENEDQRWIEVRAEPITDYMRSVRKVVNDRKEKIPLSVMVHHKWGYRGDPKEGGLIDGALRGLLCDVRTWAREGLADEMVAAGYYVNEGTPELGYRYLQEETEGRVPIWLYAWVPNNSEEFKRDYELAKKLGAKQILFWEADYLGLRPEPIRTQIFEAAQEAISR